MPASFYNRDVVEVARQLLGKRLVRTTGQGRLTGRIVETEAYLAQDDSACHSFRGPTARNRSMFGPPGRAYVYSIHARFCLNVVTEPEGTPSAVLIRGLEPLEGVGQMQQARQRQELRELTRGPARLCQALAVDRALDGWDLTCGRQLWIAEDPGWQAAEAPLGTSSRIGVTSARDLPLRFYLIGNPFVSGRPK